MSRVPRVVVVTRPTPYALLLQQHGTHGQAKFYLETRGQDIGLARFRHETQRAAEQLVMADIPLDWRRASVAREDLDRFLFEDDDIVVAVGQDGLVANSAKYLPNLPVIGINPDPGEYDGVLAKHRAEECLELLRAAHAGRAQLEARTLVEVRVDQRQSLVALNEVFLGHRSHQSARYRVEHDGRSERQSSSGVIVSTGTGATGWARSIAESRGGNVRLPQPCEPWLRFFVREAFPSVAKGTRMTSGAVDLECPLEIVSEMDDGVIFGDGIEADCIRFGWGMRAEVKPSRGALRLVVGA